MHPSVQPMIKAISVFNPAFVAALAAAAAFVLLSTIEPLLIEVRAERDGAVPLGLPPLPAPPVEPSVAALGKRLFFERRLSINDTMSCGMCHIEAQAFTSNDLATSVGMEGKSLRRNAPSILNVAYEKQLFRDGREDALETQAWLPILTHDEIAAPSVGWALAKLRTLPEYPALFEETFPGRGITMETLGAAIAAYERTLLSGDSRFDRWRFGGETDALTVNEQNGFELFTGKAGCSSCHQLGADSALFTDGKFHDIGLGYAKTMGHRARQLRRAVGGRGCHPAASERRGIDYKSDRERPWSVRGDAGPQRSLGIQDARPARRRANPPLYARWITGHFKRGRRLF